ncbi:MAG: AMP-binding protein [Chloroflexota bacterium]
MTDPLVVAAARWPDAPAVADGAVPRTWARLLRDALQLAHALDVAPGARVALLADDRADAVVGIHAARLAGAVLVPLHRRLSAVELTDQVSGTRPELLLHDDAHADVAGAIATGVSIRTLYRPSRWPDRRAQHASCRRWGDAPRERRPTPRGRRHAPVASC